MAPRTSVLASKPVGALGVIAPPPIHVTTPTFDGSLATLFGCVRDHKIDLLDVPLFPICEAYFAYLLASERRDLDEAAAALAALAYLLERKAWLLLPSEDPEPEIEDASSLPEPTAHEYRLAIEALSVWHEARKSLFFRAVDGPNPYEIPLSFSEITPGDLSRAFEEVLRRATPEPFEPPSKPRLSLQEQMGRVLLAIGFEWRSLSEMLPEPYTRSEAVYRFLALLELMRLGQVAAKIDETTVRFARS